MQARLLLPLFLAVAAWGQAPEASRLMDGYAAHGAPLPLAVPAPEPPPMAPSLPVPRPEPAEGSAVRQAQERLEAEVRRAKEKEGGPRRFAADLFDYRQSEPGVTEGGLAEDYVLGIGDRLRLSLFGSATQEVNLVVDGRGTLVIPRVGTVQVAGRSLGRAREEVERRIQQVYSRTTVDLAVTRLREVRVFVLGEVYRPGSFLVPNLASLINVLSLSGGPTAAGSFRKIRLVRGGRTVTTVDLYPLRAEGAGNFNLGFQNGDTVFVPLLENPVRVEGAFTRVVATVPEQRPRAGQGDSEEQTNLKRQIRSLEASLELPSSLGEAPEEGLGPKDEAPGRPEAKVKAKGLGQDKDLREPGAPSTGPQRSLMLEQLKALKEQLRLDKTRVRGDKRIRPEEGADELAGQPAWISRWLAEGKAPVMQFEMLPGETVWDAIRFAGGFALQSFAGAVSVKRITASGALEVLRVPAGDAMARTVLERGDVLMALPQRDGRELHVKVAGWARVHGVFARAEGMRVGDLLRDYGLVLPDTYLGRGELVRTSEQGSRQYVAFDLGKALAGDAAHNLPLQDRDEVELYRVGDLRLPRTLTVVGPVQRPGTFEFLEGMRASDLLFRAGVPLLKANRFVAELSQVREGSYGAVRPLDLGRLLSTEGGSPVDLRDDEVNPRLQPFDQIVVYARPDFKVHRTITLSGQVVRPGAYELDSPGVSLREILARAGGLTREAMPQGGIFLRSMGQADPEKAAASARAGVVAQDPTANGINEILNRLSETKRMTTGALLANPLLHGLTQGSLNRLVVDLPGLLAGDPAAEVELQDGDEVIIPRRTDVAYVVGETASPFGAYKVRKGMTVRAILAQAGGPTRNADTWGIRLLKADGRIVDRGVKGKEVEPGDALLVPQRIRRDVTWQENLAALTPLAILINAVRN